MTQQIVIAWVEMTGLKATGRQVMRDLNWFPEFTTAPEAKACMWLRKGTEDDIEDYGNFLSGDLGLELGPEYNGIVKVT